MNMTQPSFELYLRDTSQEIQKELQIFSKEWNRYIANDFSDLKKSNMRFTESLFGGKMIRGTLVKFGYELIQTKNIKAILKPAAAFEIFHSSLLIHDDIIDQSPIRRGKLTLFMTEKNKHHGISQAICLGDLGITLAVNSISESDFPLEVKNMAIRYFLKMISKTILGEMLDVQASQKYNRKDEQVIKIHKMKTANYTIVGPLSVGAILAGASEKFLENIQLFGEYLGIAFQIQDDILGIFGDDKKIGKSTTSDIQENKNTLLFTYSLKKANQKQKDILKMYYGKKNITLKQQEMIRKVFIETGALDQSKKTIMKLTLQAKELIPNITKEKNKQLLLAQFVDLLVSRKK